MELSTLTPTLHRNTLASTFVSLSPPLYKLTVPRLITQPRRAKIGILGKPNFTPIAAISDPHVLQIAETLEDSLASTSSPTPPLLQKLKDISSETLLSTPWPSRKDEPFRFTDTSFLKSSEILPIQSPNLQLLSSLAVSGDTDLPIVLIIDGYIVNHSSQSSQLLPSGVFVGGLSDLKSQDILKRVSVHMSSFQGDLFWALNGVGTPDVVLIYVPKGCRVETTLHLKHFAVEGSDRESKTLPISNPRVLVMVEKGGEVGIVEEYVGGDGEKCYWTNSVVEVVIGEGGKVTHSYIQNQSLNAAHIKWTWVQQESSSIYKLIEVSTGGKLSRHNIHIQQAGPDTVTELSTFHLSVTDQTQDLHSKLVLDHPRGYSQQLHKCIVAHSSGQAVFDGNVQVNRNAQQTDAGQLTRSLLLEPRATVNVKPNLQIIADDVKCSHGAAISDLEEDQLFYLQARGIDIKSARKALVFSFAAEVVSRLPDDSIRKKVEDQIRTLLESTNPKP